MESAVPAPTPSRIETEVRRIREFLERGQFAAALAALQPLRSEVPANRDVLLMTAVGQRYLGNIPDSLATLAVLEQHHPEYAWLYQERGHCYVGMRAAAPAIESFAHAVALNSSLAASWNALQLLYRMTDRPVDADHAAAQAANLAALPAAIVTAFSLYADGQIQDAEHVVRQYLLSYGDHVEGMRLLAQIGVRMDVLDDAEVLLENLLRLAPNHHVARYEYALVLLKRHKHVRAREEMEKLLKLEPDNPAFRTTYATVCTGFGHHELALPLYKDVLRRTPREPELHLSIAHSLKTLGRTQEAIDSYHAAAAARPDFGEAYWSLANLKTYRFTDAEIDQMRSEEARPNIALADRYNLCFAIGKAQEDRRQYEDSFRYYERGNALKKTECLYRPESLERTAQQQISLCTREFFAARQGFGCADTAPIFIVGLPRSGSTLIEQILASHSQVEGTMELADIPRLVQDLQGRETQGSTPRYPGILAKLGAEDFRHMGEGYLSDTSVYRGGKFKAPDGVPSVAPHGVPYRVPFFIDKMPNNFRHLGLIHLILPNAKIIDARREALACCFSNFKQLFASGQQFTYSVEDITRYYRMYVDLMAHWDAVLPGKILRVDHESVVLNLETNVRRILDHCQLEFEPSCVDFHRTKRSVHTASSEQVRQPIFREGLDQWRHFEPWLGPFKLALGPLVEPA
jgi:tetratricopeptide (TPR) repeat protein